MVPQPKFVQFNDNILFLSEHIVNRTEADALKAYLDQTGYTANRRVQKLIIDQCGVSDQSFSAILEGLCNQSGADPISGRIKTQWLQSITYSNNELGIESL